MKRYFFVLAAVFFILIIPNFAKAEEKSILEIGHALMSQDNKTVRFIAAYAENSTSVVSLIPKADCKISFTDQPSPKPMSYNPGTSYDFTRVFTESAKIDYTVTCSSQNYTQQTKSKRLELVTDFLEVVLISPQNTVTTRNVNFICEVRGNKPNAINLYSDTSGEWKLRASSQIKTTRSPFRVNFTEDYVSDGSYKWNCEAETGKGTKFAPSDKKFTLKFSPKVPDCFEAVDCTSWEPQTCSGDKQTRSCNKTAECSYTQSRNCTLPATSPDNGIVLQSPIPTLPDTPGSAKSKDTGLGILPILLLVLVIAGVGAFLLIKFKRKKQASKDKEKEGDIFDELATEELPEEPEDQENQEPEDEDKK